MFLVTVVIITIMMMTMIIMMIMIRMMMIIITVINRFSSSVAHAIVRDTAPSWQTNRP